MNNLFYKQGKTQPTMDLNPKYMVGLCPQKLFLFVFSKQLPIIRWIVQYLLYSVLWYFISLVSVPSQYSNINTVWKQLYRIVLFSSLRLLDVMISCWYKESFSLMGENLIPIFACNINKDHSISQNVTCTCFKRFTSRLVQSLADLKSKQAQMNLPNKLVWAKLFTFFKRCEIDFFKPS